MFESPNNSAAYDLRCLAVADDDCQRPANQKRDSVCCPAAAFISSPFDRRPAEARAGSGRRIPAQARAGSHAGLLPQTGRARAESAGPTAAGTVTGATLPATLPGHYLSAVSLMYAATGDQRFKARADYIVKELKEVQDKNGDGFRRRPGGRQRKIR